MIRLGLRLAVAGGRESLTRLALIAVAVAVGVGLLLATLAGLNAVNTQNARYGWLETGYAASDTPPAGPSATGKAAPDPLWWQARADQFQGKQIGRVDVAATGRSSPVPPGLTRLPRPGELYASPVLAELLRRTPAAQLGDRYPGHLVGTIGAAALPSPDSLVLVIGRTVADLSRQPDARLVSHISTTAPDHCGGPGCAFGLGINHNGIVLILTVVAAALLFPVLIFIGAATRLSAARREQRFAAMRLVGATPRQVSLISIVESTLATVVGVAAGFAVFFAERPAIATIPFTGDRFFTGDLALNVYDVLVVVFGLPIGAAAAAWLALRRVAISPLGVTRRVTPPPPRAWRLVPLLAGVGELAFFAYVHDIGARTHTDTTVEALLFLLGLLLVMAGLVVAGPWLTMLATRLVTRRAGRPATLIAARRLADNPQAAFRAVSGLVLAVFVGTSAVAIIASLSAGTGTSGGLGNAADSTLIEVLAGADSVHPATPADAANARALTSIPGVRAVAVIHDQPAPVRQPAPGQPPMQQVVSCVELTMLPALGRCPPGATAVTVMPDYVGSFGLARPTPMRNITWPAAGVPAGHLAQLPIDSIVVGTDGSPAAVERARTALDLAYPLTFAAHTATEMQGDRSRLLDDYRRLADVVILTSLPIAGCSLAVAIAGGLLERKRPFSLLRLAGAPLSVLRRVVGLEAAAPLLITAAMSVVAGLLSTQLFLRAQLRATLHLPGPTFYLVLLAGLLAALAVMASALPMLSRITGPDTARNE